MKYILNVLKCTPNALKIHLNLFQIHQNLLEIYLNEQKIQLSLDQSNEKQRKFNMNTLKSTVDLRKYSENS